MFVAMVVVSVVLAALLVWSAVRKLGHREDVVRDYARVGVPEHRLNHLAVILLAGAAGVLAGLVWAPVGVAAGIGVVAYFVLAVIAHVRAGDTGNLPTPLVLVLLGAVALALRLATL